MTNITFKNGLPLLLQPYPGSEDGQVAADSGCCCPPPPPDRCWCGSFCSYFLELVEPSEIAFKTPVFVCNDSNSSEASASIGDFLFSGDFDYNADALSYSLGRVLNFQLIGTANHQGQGAFPYVENGEERFYLVDVAISAFFEVTCLYYTDAQPFYRARLGIRCDVRIGDYFFTYGNAGRKLDGTFDIPSECVVSPERECVPPGLAPPPPTQEFSRIITPLEVTFSGDGTSSLGALDDAPVQPGPRPGDLDAQEIADAIAEASSWTFRITARENCLPPENVCCCLENTVTVSTAEECDGTTSPVADPIVDLEDITIAVDWDGLTVVCEEPFFTGSASEAVEFSCLTPASEEAFNATERNFTANFFPQTSGNCRWFSSNIGAFFVGKYPSNNFDVTAQSSQLTPYVGECKLLAPVDEDDTSCTFTENNSWCMDNPFSDTVTVEMIIAP